MTTKQRVMTMAVAVLVAMSMATQASAELITLTSGDSTVEIDPDSSDGAFDWTIQGQSYLAQQWFWLRTTTDGLYDDREYSLDEISPASVDQVGPNTVDVVYDDGQLEIEVLYMLVSGPGLLTADLAEVITITNRTEEEIELDFFQYSDFDLDPIGDDDLINITGGNTVLQTDTDGSTSLSETVVSRNPDLSEVGEHPDTLDKLEDGDIDDLDGTTASAGPGDLAWAFQWKNRVIFPDETFVIAKDKVLVVQQPIPEPGAALMLAVGLTGLAARKRRK